MHLKSDVLFGLLNPSALHVLCHGQQEDRLLVPRGLVRRSLVSGVHGGGQMPLCMVVGSMAHPRCKAVLEEKGMGSLGHSLLHSSPVSHSSPKWFPKQEVPSLILLSKYRLAAKPNPTQQITCPLRHLWKFRAPDNSDWT